MTCLLSDIINCIHDWAPVETAATWDNVGLQLGSVDQKVSRVLIALEIDLPVLSLLQIQDFDLVITHHPLFFKPLKLIDYTSDMGQVLKTCFSKQIAVLAAHTNLDVAKGGVNDCLITHYALDPSKGWPLSEGFGAVLDCDLDFNLLRAVMPCRVLGDQDQGRWVKKIAFCAGSGHGLVQALPAAGVDTFITGEVTYHDHVFCEFHGIRIITVGHYASEVLVLPEIAKRLAENFDGLSVSQAPVLALKPECELY
eukprot:COSAG01_NODE_3_length_63519_cov_1591.007663_21_plen_254_part_00